MLRKLFKKKDEYGWEPCGDWFDYIGAPVHKNGLEFRRIICRTKGNPHIQNGKVGGFVGKDVYISKTAWVGRNAFVGSKAVLEGESIVTDRATVIGDVHLDGKAIVRGNARVTGNVEIKDEAQVYGNCIISGNVILQDEVIVTGSAVLTHDVRLTDKTKVGGSSQISGDIVLRGYSVVKGTDVLQGGGAFMNWTSEKASKSANDEGNLPDYVGFMGVGDQNGYDNPLACLVKSDKDTFRLVEFKRDETSQRQMNGLFTGGTKYNGSYSKVVRTLTKEMLARISIHWLEKKFGVGKFDKISNISIEDNKYICSTDARDRILTIGTGSKIDVNTQNVKGVCVGQMSSAVISERETKMIMCGASSFVNNKSSDNEIYLCDSVSQCHNTNAATIFSSGKNNIILSAANECEIMVTGYGSVVDIYGDHNIVTVTGPWSVVNVCGSNNRIQINGANTYIDLAGKDNALCIFGQKTLFNVTDDNTIFIGPLFDRERNMRRFKIGFSGEHVPSNKTGFFKNDELTRVDD